MEIDKYKQNEKQFSDSISRLKSQINEKNLLIDTKEKEITISNNIIKNQKDNTINSLNEKIKMNSEKFSLSESKKNKYENKFKENYLKQRNITNDSEYLQEITKEKYLSLTIKYEKLNKEKEEIIKIYEKLKEEYNSINNKYKDEINKQSELMNENNKNKEIISNYEKEISLLKDQIKNNSKYLLNQKIEEIKQKYKENIEEEIKNLKKPLIKAAADKLKKIKDNFDELYKEKNNDFIQKIGEIEKLIIDNNKIKEENLKLKKEINEYKDIIYRYPFILNDKEYLISLIIVTKDEKVMFSIIGKNTDKFNSIENKFFIKYPEYIEDKGRFYHRNNLIDKNKTLEECKLKENDIIIFDNFEKIVQI